MNLRAFVIAIALPLGGCGASAFACNDASQCLASGVAGTCQPDGWCSFPDPECESGERYGDHAGEDVAGRCVPSGGSTSGVGGSDEHMTSIDSTVGESTLTSASTSTGASTSVDTSDSDTNTTTTSTTTTTTTTTDTGIPRNCGDGVQQPGEECDEGPSNDNHGGCTTSCTLATCGDGFIQGDEVCDAPELGEVDCSYWGYSNGELSCADDCQGVDISTCEGCNDESCIPFGACNFGMNDCANGDNCVSVGSMTGTCQPPCDVGCPMGSFCTSSFMTCALSCQDDADCPANMHCAQLPSDDQGACMW